MSEEAKETLRQYIMHHSGCTIGKVVEHMNSLKNVSLRLSRVTTMKLINDYASRGIITIEKAERTGQSYHLMINQANVFNSLNECIYEIETFVSIVLNNLQIIFQFMRQSYSEDSEYPDELEVLLAHFRISLDVVKTMIDVLLIEIFSEVKSVEEKEILGIRTMKLLARTLKYFLQPRPPLSVIEFFGLSNVKITESVKSYGKNIGVAVDNLPYLVQKVDDFEKYLLRSSFNRNRES